MSQLIEVVNHYATRRHYADPNSYPLQGTKARFTLCSPYTFGRTQQDYEQLMVKRGKLAKTWLFIPFCKHCEQLAEKMPEPWRHPGHNPRQHRDKNPPWCEACGYTSPVSAIPAKQIKVIEVSNQPGSGSIEDGGKSNG